MLHYKLMMACRFPWQNIDFTCYVDPRSVKWFWHGCSGMGAGV